LLELVSGEGRIILHKVFSFVLAGSWEIKLGFRRFLAVDVFGPHVVKFALVADHYLLSLASRILFIYPLLVSGPKRLVLQHFILLEA